MNGTKLGPRKSDSPDIIPNFGVDDLVKPYVQLVIGPSQLGPTFWAQGWPV